MSLDLFIIGFLMVVSIGLCFLCWRQDDRIDQLETYISLHDRDWNHD